MNTNLWKNPIHSSHFYSGLPVFDTVRLPVMPEFHAKIVLNLTKSHAFVQGLISYNKIPILRLQRNDNDVKYL